MFGVLQIVLPVFVLVGAGYATRRGGILSDDQCDALMRFCMMIGIPVLLFKNLAVLELGAAFRLDNIITFYAGTLSAFVIGSLIGRYVFGRNPGGAVAFGFCATFANLVLLGWPLVERAYGVEAVQPIIAIVALHAPVCYLLGITTIEFARADGRSLRSTSTIVAKAMFSNAIMIGIALGVLFNLTPLNLPEILQVPVDLIARSAAPVALFALGGVLVRYKISNQSGELATLSLLRLIWHPLVAFLVGKYIFGIGPDFLKAIVLGASMPSGINTYVFATMYQRAEAAAAANILVSTAFSIITISVWLIILG